ncbi:stage III sporulation protein SpoIIIAB [Paenibacillus sp.]|uniref:stage III sporulation protein SpoIIIAB n=1 Tax=Paenibacillus sp. TaxID=58172 RepID=UPI002D27652D|nr:stage III sporulation protein SpoIIIAB [Paenibacillus sp.]HZG58063.1 stage III sporulation protein SpoIIIAB [Paenibacillus sp.]
MLKWIGATMILAAGTAYGFAQASRYARRPKELRSLAAALGTLESEVVYGLSPLPAAMARVSTATQRPIAFLFEEASSRLRDSRSEKTAGECWAEAIEAVWPRTALGAPEKATLLALSATLGATDRNDQAKHLRLAVAQLAAEEETAREEQARYGKMWRSLGALTAALIVILMY